MTVDKVSPLVIYLASRRCAETRRVFSVGCGHIARVFVAASRGWYVPGLGTMTPEQVESNLDAACDLADFGTPDSMNDESNYISAQMPQAQ
jgi:hypothetical protein